ncbi:MAG TPA: PQQ-dependent sugar dehydrogenase, partial [Chryseosolibacter sp.]|nr:PQQ-dependent sugar dehydrogenase [Chryseosolibacter sp.]
MMISLRLAVVVAMVLAFVPTKHARAGAMPAPADTAILSTAIVAAHLDVPWDITWGPDNWIWFTEQSGAVSKVNPETGEQKLLLRVIPDVYRHRTLGLLCMALHPDMKNFPFVFLNYIYMKGNELKSRWVRYTYNGNKLIEPITLLELPADIGHNGSRIVFSPDGKLLLATGDADHKNDAANSGNAQNLSSFSGKVLRLNIDGTIPHDNPFPGSPVWASGFRVPQGIVYASNGKLYTAEHGNLADDEVNLIAKGANYGYPNVSGVCDKPGEKDFCDEHNVVEPLIAWTPTIAPAGIDYYNNPAIPQWRNSLLLTTLKGQSLRVLKLNDDGSAVREEKVYFEKTFGRLRDVCVAPNGDVYIATSNRDWNPSHGYPVESDDRIIRISSEGKQSTTSASSGSQRAGIKKTESGARPVVTNLPGKSLYESYCASCHKEDGTGVPGTFPPLKRSARVAGNKVEVVKVMLDGLSGPITVDGVTYDMEMPALNFLSDKEVADIAEYVRATFAGKHEKISPEEVGRV